MKNYLRSCNLACVLTAQAREQAKYRESHSHIPLLRHSAISKTLLEARALLYQVVLCWLAEQCPLPWWPGGGDADK